MILADKIIEERKKNGWSQEELAAQLGVSRQAVSKWESAGSIPDLKRVIQLAELFGVSTDYLLKDEMVPEVETSVVYETSQTSDSCRTISMEEANDFLNIKKSGAPVIANGVALCILSPVLLVVLGSLAEAQMFHITEGIAAAVGCTILLGMIAAAVFMFITCSIREKDMEHLEKENFETEYGVSGMVKEKKRAFEGDFTRGIALGAVLCIVAVVPVIISGSMEAPDYITGIFVGLLLVIVAIGVNLIVRVSIIKGSYDILLQEGDYTKTEKTARKKLDAFSGAYWCIATAIYLGWSFTTNRWDFTWIVWPIAGVSFAAVCAILRIVLKIDEA